MSRHSPTGFEWLVLACDAGPGPCLEYPYARFRNGGYGQVSVNNHPHRAHVVVYEILHGPLPAGLVVRHSCDNPPCCNPHHLLAGTQAANMADKGRRGRQPRKIRQEQATEVRRRCEAGERPADLAREFGVTQQAIAYYTKRRR